VVSGLWLWWQASAAQEILNAGIGAPWAVHLMKLTASELGGLPVGRGMEACQMRVIDGCTSKARWLF